MRSNNRSHIDQLDETDDPQIHFLYVLPSDGMDRQLDIRGAIEISVNAFLKWLSVQTGGITLRTDTFNGSLDISFYRLTKNDTEMQSYGAWLVTEIEKELKVSGFNSTNKIYAVYYDGGSNYACGGAAWPPLVPGQYVAMYLLAKPTGYAVPCSVNNLTSSIDQMGYWEYAMLHDIFHALGAVSLNAPHHVFNGHVSDSNKDLMYSGSESWNPSILDYGSDDYYGHNKSNYVDIKKSSFLKTITIENSSNTMADTSLQTSANLNTNISFFSIFLVFFLVIIHRRYNRY